jgi:6-phosphogluconolactonase
MAAGSVVSAIAGRAIIAPDPASLAHLAAGWLATRIDAKQGPFRLVLSGGSTPRALYALLGSEYRARIDWSRVELFWGDERFVPYSDPDSNFRMAQETLLSKIDIPSANVHPIPTNGEPADAAHCYEILLRNIYGSEKFNPARPLFDVILLGLGSDGHTASLLPGEPVLEEHEKWVASVMHGRTEPRITLTYPAIASSAAMALLVTGSDKAQAVRKARAGDISLPAARIRAQGEVIWFLDSASASDSSE